LSINPQMSNTGYPYAQQQGLVEQAVMDVLRVWDEDPDEQPVFSEWLPFAGSPRGAMDWSGNIRIDPGGYSPLSDPQADPTFVSDYYAKTHWNAYTVKKGFTYNSMDRVHGHPELINNRTREAVRNNKRAMDVWTARFILGDPVARALFNPSGEFDTYVIEFDCTYGGTKPQVDQAGSDVLELIDDAMDFAQYQGTTENAMPTLIVGPKGEKALKNHSGLRDIIKQSDFQALQSMIGGKRGTYSFGFHGVSVRKMNGSYKVGASGSNNLERASGGFTKVTVQNKLRRFLLEDPLNPRKECGLLLWDNIGTMRFALTDERNSGNYASGGGYLRGPVEEVLKGVWAGAFEHAFCPCIDNPFNLVVLKNFVDSWQK